MHRRSKKQLDMSSPDYQRKCLGEDVGSLIRVRNRFSRSSDEKLNTVMPALIPKLFKRLENYRVLIMNESMENSKQFHLNDSALSSLDEARININGILCHAMERLRGNAKMPTESIVQALIAFIDSKNPVVVTWASAFLQVSIPRISVENFELSSSIISPLIELLGRLHKRLNNETESSASYDPLEAHWVSISWLVLDSIVLNSGQTPVVDWDIDSFNGVLTTRRMRMSNNLIKNHDKFYSSSSILGETKDGLWAIGQYAMQGFFSLALDLLIYWPQLLSTNNTTILSTLGVRRMEHRKKKLDAVNINNQEQLFYHAARQQEHDLRLERRELRGKQWSDANQAYLSYIKLACLELALSLSNRDLSHSSKDDHAVVLSILFASHESMHGRIAASYLTKRTSENPIISIPVATYILILIIGEVQAEEVLDSFGNQYKTKFWEQLLGPKSSNQNMKRPAIDWAISLMAADFILDNSLKWGDLSNCSDVDDDVYVTLLIELSLKISETNDEEHQYLAMRLVSSFYCHLKQPKTSTVLKIFDLIIRVLTIMVDFVTIDDLRTTTRHTDRAALGVPQPYHHRNDLNRLLQDHRQSLKRKSLNKDIAMLARKNAYTMIPHLSTYTFERPEASHFQLPITLLQCAVFEDLHLENYLTKALDSTLTTYKKKFDQDLSLIGKKRNSKNASPQQQATLFLPALLETVCSDTAYVRMNAIQWIQKLLMDMDIEAAYWLASHLVHDENMKIARMAKVIVDATKSNLSRNIFAEKLLVSFIDLNDKDGFNRVQNNLKHRSRSLVQRLEVISYEESIMLLLNFKFSVAKAEFEYRKSSEACRKLCGLVIDKDTAKRKENDDDVECDICYDDIEAKHTYSLNCGHRFCKTCWVSYLTDAAGEPQFSNFLDLRCPHHDCNSRVMLHDLQRLKPCLIPAWNNAILRKFIEEDPFYRYCSGPNCQCVAVKSNQKTVAAPHSLKVTCTTCSTSFCFDCGENAHVPATCQDIAQWNVLKGSSQFWVKRNSKPCPGCNVPIEKNKGCNHMQCSNCKTDFCWLCLSVLNSHLEPHICNHYDPTDSAEDDFESQALFTVPRYDAHDTAATFTRKQYEKFDPDKLLESFWFLDEDEDPDIMARAFETLLTGREFLKNSYVAMLGLRRDTSRLKVHEDRHACLEMFTERLSQLSETNLQSLYTLRGQAGILHHFRRLTFYTAAVIKYMERMTICEG